MRPRQKALQDGEPFYFTGKPCKSGLHVETNLQIIPERMNIQKKNRLIHIPDELRHMLWGG